MKYTVDSVNKEDRIEDQMESIEELQENIDKNLLFINALDPVKNASDIEFFERENVKLNSRLLDKQDAVEKSSTSRLNSIFKKTDVEILAIKGKSILDVIKEAFTFRETQVWPFDDYGLKTT
ncbi:hypothetical protein [Flammeovirga kamogawensis]|uniref:Uncharacterized protein n=1 Tax=Flammeovirga kamogawensis TaxID=373891 RepID=A0ABX8GT02_9BACT|nr:hypothetical protein [Flammeovirga kamogawensis]MBB6462899.1 hypothetical protein [Flammeovirga kamogawensis]QWG06428.1 hypothetical protein KM029_13955 [Flammeovirga kamogawensis]TRX68259.1 hypothetical protein EO216_08970 [Flammeovirga kamogawensis]